MSFADLQLIAPILDALNEEGYTSPTPIQQQAIPVVLQGKDLLGCAQTGTGKTAAFAIPILQLLYQHKQAAGSIRALILTPTRELAIQIDESFAAYGRNTGLKHAVIFGGVSQQKQVEAIRKGVDILIATPGRLLDLIAQRIITLRHLEFFILDEADRMLDMGFIHDVKKVITQLPAKRQTLFFSATMPPEIAKLANTILTAPVKVEVAPVSSTAEKVAQCVYMVEKKDKAALLQYVLKDKSIDRVLVFTRTKHGADRVAKQLNKHNIKADAIHGDKSQNARQRALTNFKSGDLRVLVATDIAARGIDVEELSYVINYELPNVPETYVHRIGRTGRAGWSGKALSFCDFEEREYLRDINKLTAQSIPVITEHPYLSAGAPPTVPVPQHMTAPKSNTPARKEGKRNGPNPRRKWKGHGNKTNKPS
ncbi:DEAD/DEAH box helicase [Chitinophaga pendula]|uniref:DEAD/DEAH box helicase n=1 Tax=Chitinophaga TaxID=79328 RepID=UPI000BAEFB4F|nr:MULTISPECIES: DEAD/DEAH box helicase [Chitinophaga]ASZ12764.1 DEAD/DEAH box helicase [Chitinophaga sp. MD30]UCJ09616.1 DEAD/DEAH box helicase [Chitinophaga pendula]